MLDVKKIRLEIGKTQKEFSELLGVRQSSVSMWEKGDRKPNVKMALKIKELHYKLSQKITKQPYASEGKLIYETEYPSKSVTIIDVKGRGGLENVFYDKMYMDKLDKENLTIKEPSSNGSEWFKIEVEGISMDDSTKDYEGSKYSLCEGDWAYCRSISRIHWRNKLHFQSVKVFCFFHNTRGILFKKVKSHDIDNGELVLTSLNKDKKMFPDFVINVSECTYICNVIKVLSEF